MTSPALRAQVVLERPGFTLDVDLELPGSGVTVLFGHSGSGKTTVLRCIAGLERARRGTISFNGEIWQNGSKFVPPHRRAIGYVFQEASLFDHLSARQNLEFALKRASPGRNPVSLDQVVDLLGLERILANYPAQLSGGERQRVAIARALLINPRLLLMDEPLASLDVARKREILPYLEELKQRLDLPIIYVSHSPDEVARLADYLVAMADGAAVASGTLTDTLSRLDFPLKLGEETGVVLEAKISARDERWQLARVSFSGGELWFRDNGYGLGAMVRVRILARDISLSLDNHSDSSIINALPARVLEVGDEDHPGLALVRLQVADSILIARVTRRSAHNLGLAPGKEIWAQIKSVAIVQ